MVLHPGRPHFPRYKKCMKFHTPDITNVRHAKYKNRRSDFVRSWRAGIVEIGV